MKFQDKLQEICGSEFGERDLNLEKAITGVFEKMNARGLIHSSMTATKVAEVVKSELLESSMFIMQTAKEVQQLYFPKIIADEFKTSTFSLLKQRLERLQGTKMGRLKSVLDSLQNKNILKSISLEETVINIQSDTEFQIDKYLAERKNNKKYEQGSAKPTGAGMKPTSKEVWDEIYKDYEITKRSFAKRINFVSDKFKKSAIFRDIEHAYSLAGLGYSKPAVILSGSVIEELLRLYLKHKGITPARNNFDSYIKACENNGLIKSAIHRLTDSVRHFRNYVHLEKEESSRSTISKATAKGAVSSIFTIANDL